MHFDRQFSGLEFSMRLSVLQFHFSPHSSWWFDWKFSAHSHIQQQQQIDLSLSRPIYQLQKVKRFDADKWIQNGNLCELMLCEVYFWRVFMVFHSTATHLKYKRHHLNSSNWREGVGSICWNLNLSKSFDESQYKNDITECHISKFSALWITVGYECGNFWGTTKMKLLIEVAYWSLTNEHTKKHFFGKAVKIVSNRYERQSTEWKKH